MPISVYDPDGNNNTEFRFELDSVQPQSNYFLIDSKTGAITTSSLLDVDITKVFDYEVTIRVYDMDNFSSTFLVEVAIEDVNDNPPVPENDTYYGRISENAPASTTVSGLNIVFNDADSGLNSELTYTIEPSSPFSLESPDTTVIISTQTFDYEEDKLQYEFVITAYDKGNPIRNGTTRVVIDLIDMNDNRPVVAVEADPIPIFEEGGEPVLVASVNITDKDSDVFLLQYGIVSITDAKDSQEQLNYVSSVPGLLKVGTTPSRDKIIIIGEGTPEEYEDLLSSVTYENTANEMSPPLQRTIRFGVSDLPLSPSFAFGSGFGMTNQLTTEEVDDFLASLNDSDVSYATGTVTLQPVNDQPVLACPSEGFVTLSSIIEDIRNTSNTGQNVSSILNSIASDPDFETSPKDIGIAIIDSSNSGDWEYSINGGQSFIKLTNSLSASSATLLGPSSLIRFSPDADSIGSSRIVFKAWDLSDGYAAGSTGINTTEADLDSTASFSIATCIAVIEVLPVNDAPLINLHLSGPISPNTSIAYVENQTPKIVTIVELTEVDVYDKDHSYLPSLTLKVSKEDGSCDIPDYDDEVLDELVPNLSVMKVAETVTYEGGACWTYTYEGNHTHQQWEWFISNIRFRINASEPSDHTRRIEYVISDGQTTSIPVYAFIEVSLVSDNCPVITSNITGPLTYIEHSDALLIDDSFEIYDDDFNGKNPRVTASISVANPVIEVSFGDSDAESRTYDCGNCILSVTTRSPIVASYNNKVLTLEGPATPEQFEEVLQTLEFVDNGTEPSFASMATLTIEVEDDSSLTCNDFEVNIILEAVNDHPADIRLNGDSLNFTTNYTEESQGIRIVGDVRVNDPDTVDSTRYEVTVEIIDGFIASEDELTISDDAHVKESTNSKIVLQGSLKQIASSLALITYRNTDTLSPNTNERIIRFYMTDNSLPSVSAFTTISITSVNDRPDIELTGGMVFFSIGGDPVLIAPESRLSDPEGDDLTSMTLVLNELDENQNSVSLTDTFSESLVFTETAGISGSYNQQHSTIEFTGKASTETYEQLLKTVKYSNTNPDPTVNLRVVKITISDGLLTDTAQVYIAITGDAQAAPVVDLNGDAEGSNNTITFITKETEDAVNLAPEAVVMDANNDRICSASLLYQGPRTSCSPSFLNFETNFLDISVDETEDLDSISYVLNTTVLCRRTSVFDAIFRGMTFKAANDATAGNCTLSVSVKDEHDGASNVAVIHIVVLVGNDPPYIDLDLGRAGRHFSFAYIQDFNDVLRIVSIYDESLAMNISVSAPVGEAPGEALSDSANDDFGVTVLTNLSHAGYTLTDPDDNELEYLSVKFIYNSPSELIYDSIRFPCISNNDSIVVVPEGCFQSKEVVVYSNLKCDPDLFDACNNPIDLCTNLTVTISCNTKDYRFEYSSGGTVERFETLLGNVGYQYKRNASISRSFERTLNVTAFDGKHISPDGIVSLVVEPQDETPVIDISQAFEIYEDEKPNRTHVFYTLSIKNSDNTPVDKNMVKLSIVESDIGGVFSMDNQGDFRLVSALDREEKDSYYVTVSASFLRVQFSSTATIDITVLDVNDNPPVTKKLYEVEAYENMADRFVVAINATDADIGKNGQLLYSPLLGIGAEKFKVNVTTGVIRTAVALNMSETDFYLLVLIIQDMGEIPYQTYTQIDVSVQPAPPDSVIFDVQNSLSMAVELETVELLKILGTVSAYEVGTLDASNIRYRVIGIDPTETPLPFNIDSINGSVFVSSSLDAERSQEYNITIEAYSVRSDITVTPALWYIEVIVEDVDEFPPVFFPPGPYSFVVSENAKIGDLIGEFGARDDDADEADFVFEIVEPLPAGFPFKFESGGRLVLNRSLDFENQRNYTFQVRVRDGNGLESMTSLTDVIVNITNVNDVGAVFTNTPYLGSVRETAPNGTTVLTVTYSDPDMQLDSITLTLSDLNGIFCLEGKTVFVCNDIKLTKIEEPNKVFSVDLLLVDNGFNDSTTANISLVLINEFPPEFTSTPPLSAIVIKEQLGNCTDINVHAAEVGDSVFNFDTMDQDGGVSGVIQYTLVDSDSLFFAVNSTTGELIVSGCVDADIQQNYILTVQATDGADVENTTFTRSQTISVFITDYNDFEPVITSTLIFSVTENETKTQDFFGQIVATDGDITTRNSKVVFDRKVKDLEGDGYGIGCEKDTEAIGISPLTGHLFFCEPVDFETTNTREFKIDARVRNDDGEILNPNGIIKSEEHSIYFVITVYLLDSNEHRPNITGSNFQFTVQENRENQTVVGTIAATDEDSPDAGSGILQFYLSINPTVGIDDDSCTSDIPFYINSEGMISTCGVLDYETESAYFFYVSVCDRGNPRICVVQPENVTISVIDRNDNPPIFSADFVEIFLPENYTDSVVYSLSLTDQDSDANSALNLTLETTGTPFGLQGFDIIIVNQDKIDYETLPNSYSLVVTALNKPFDPLDESQSDNISITISITDINDETPQIAEPREFEITENKPAGYFVGQVSASDREEGDNGRLTFTSLDTDIANSVCSSNVPFVLNKDSGNITTCKELDYETVESYTFMATVCDNGSPSLCDTDYFFINITDLNDNKPVFALDPLLLQIEENSPADFSMHTIVTSDQDSEANSQVTYQFINTTSPFEVRNGDEIYYTGLSPLDYEGSTDRFILQLRATNTPANPEDSTLIVDIVVVITITDCNDEPPVFVTNNDTAVSVEEHSMDGYVIYTVDTTDKDTLPNRNVSYEVVSYSTVFTMVGTSVAVKDTDALDREAIGTNIVVEVEAINPSDECGDEQTAILGLQVTVNDINDNYPYFFGSRSFMVPENASIGTLLGRVRAKDEDLNENSRLQYFIASSESFGNKDTKNNSEIYSESGDGSGSGDNSCTEELPFDIDPDSGRIQTCYDLDFELHYSFTLNIRVCDAGKPQRCNSSDAFIMVTDVNDNSPVIHGPFEFNVNETVMVSHVVGCVNATDVDTGFGGMVSFHAEGVVECIANFPFQVNETSGCISVCNDLNFEETMVYQFELLVSDLGDPQLNNTAQIRINIKNINDHGPQIVPPPTDLFVVENAVDVFVGTITAVDDDIAPHNAISFSLTDDAGGRFNITNDGHIFTKMPLDREAAPYHLITVQATDGVFFDSLVANITVTDENDEKPVYIGATSFNRTENSDIEIELNFVDNDLGVNAEITLQLVSNDPRFWFDSNSPLILRNNQTIDRDPETGGTPTILLTIIAIDSGIPQLQSDPVTISINVGDVNDNHPIPLPPFKGNVSDGTLEGTFVVSLSGTDYDEGDNADLKFTLLDNNDTFYINDTGLFTKRDITLDSDQALRINVSILISDLGEPSLSTSYTIVIYVIDTLPIFTPNTYKFYAVENAYSVDVGEVLASDRDLINGNEDFEFSILSYGPYGGFTLINSTIYSPSSYIDYEDNDVFTLTVGVGNGEMIFDEANVSVCVNETNETPPFLSPLNITAELRENAATGHVLGQVVAIDVDAGINGEVSYEIISGKGAGFFSIDNDGNLLLKNSSAADFESYPTFVFTYHACDNGVPQLCSDPGHIFINVLDSDDVPPVFNPSYYERKVSELFGTDQLLLEVSVTDEDTDVADLVFTLSPQYPQFRVVQVSGNIFTTTTPLDYESASSFTFSVVATDQAGLNDTATVVINVIDEDDNRARVESNVTLFQPLEDSPIPISLSALTVVDEDAINVDMMDEIEVSLTPSPTSNQTFPFDGGFCDHANSSYIDSSSISVCGLEPVCNDWQEDLLPINGATEKDGIIIFNEQGIARHLPPIPVYGSDLASNFTFSFWISVSLEDGEGQILVLERDQQNVPLIVHILSTGIIEVYSTVSGDQRDIVQSTIPLSSNTNHHLAIVREGDSMFIYIDGKQSGSSNKASDLYTSFSGSAIVIFGESLVGTLAQSRFCPGHAFSSSNASCITSCGEIFGADSTKNIAVSVDHRKRSVNFKCNVAGNCSLAEMNAALDTLTFINIADEPNPVDRGLVVSASDTQGFGEQSIFTIRPSLVNDKLPLLDLNGDETDGINSNLMYVERSGMLALVSNDARLYDLDSGFWTFSKIVVSLLNPTAEEIIEETSDALPDTITVNSTINTTLTLSSVSSNGASAQEFLDALKAIKYSNEEENPSNEVRVIQFTVYDYEDVHTNIPLANATITITPANDPPVLSIDITSVEFSEEKGQVVLLEDAVITITDPDDTSMSKVTVELLDRVNNGDEVLSLDPGSSGLAAAYDNDSGILTIAGDGSIDTYISVLKDIVYSNTNTNPTSQDREIHIRVVDASDGVSVSYESVKIEIEEYNDPPVIVFQSTGNQSYYSTFVEDKDTCISAVGEYTLSDPEGRGIFSIEMAIENHDGNENHRLKVIDALLPFGAIPLESALKITLFFPFNQKDIDSIINATYAVQYCNDEEEPGLEKVIIGMTIRDVKVTDTQANTKTYITVTIQHINDLPVLSVNPIEGLAFGGEQTPFIDPDTIQFSDSDNEKFSQIQIIITNPKDGIVNEFIQAAGNLPNAGILTGTDVGDDGSFIFTVNFPVLANTETIINTIKELRYNNLATFVTADTPRTICLRVNDTKDLSNPACVNITISEPNIHSPTILNGTEISFTYDETSSPLEIGTIVAFDEDSDPIASVVAYSIDSALSMNGGGVNTDTTNLGLFTIESSSGRLTAPKGFDAESYVFHNVTVRVRDNGNPNRYNYTSILITVQDLNDNSPTVNNLPFVLDTQAVTEEFVKNTDIYTVSANDIDQTSPNNEIASYSLENNFYIGGEAIFSINQATGVISITDQPIDADTYREMILNISVTDNGTPSLTTYATLTIIPVDINDNPPEVDQLIPAVFPTTDRSPVSIGPAIRVIDNDESFVLNEVSIELQNLEMFDDYLTCTATCQDDRLKENGLLGGDNSAFDLLSLATFQNEGVSNISIGEGNCDAKRFVRLENSGNNGYGSIPQTAFGSTQFATGEFSFSFVLNITNEGHVVGLVNNANPNANSNDVKRVFAIRIRRYTFDVVYSYNGVIDKRHSLNLNDIQNKPFNTFFDPGSYNQTRHFVVVIKNDSPNVIAEIYVDCDLLGTIQLEALPDSSSYSTDVTIGRLVPGSFSSDVNGAGHLGGDLHGLYYYPYPLSINQIQDICICESIQPPASYPSSIKITEQTTTKISIAPSNGTLIPANDANEFLRGITYDYKLSNIPAGSKNLAFETEDDRNSNKITQGQISFTETDDDPPYADLNGVLVSGSDYSTSFTEDSDPVLLTDSQVRIGREANTDFITVDKVVVKLLNPLDSDSETLSAKGTDFLSVIDSSNSTLEIRGPGLSTEFAGVLQTLQYENTNQNPTASESRNISIMVHDTNGRVNTPLSYTLVTIQPVNDAPILSLSTSIVDTIETVVFHENGDPVILANDIDINDVDNTIIGSAVVSISNNFVVGKDTLSIQTMGGVTSTYQSSGVLTLTGEASIGTYEDILKTLEFSSTDNPLLDGDGLEESLIRTITISVNDGNTDSNDVKVEVEFMTVNNITTIHINGTTVVQYTEGSNPIPFAPYAYILDSDNNYLKSMTFMFEEGGEVGDVFNYNGTQSPQFSFSQDTLANLQSELRSVAYSSTNEEPPLDNRTIIITIEDLEGRTVVQRITVIVVDKNEHPPTFVGTPYSFTVEENKAKGTFVGTITATDSDVSPAQIDFTIDSPLFTIEAVDGATASIYTARSFDFETDVTITIFNVNGSDGLLYSAEKVTVTLEDVNEAPTLSLSVTSAVAAAQQSRPLLTSNLDISDPDASDEILVATFTLAGVPSKSVESLTLNESISGYTLSNSSVDSNVVYTLSKTASAEVSMVDAVRFVQYTAGEITNPLTLRTVKIVVEDSEGLESNEITVEVTLADIPEFSMSIYTVNVVEKESRPDFLQVEATVANPDDTITYQIEEYPGISINESTGYLSLSGVLDYESVKSIQLAVYAIATVPLPRTATAAVVISVLDVDDVKPNITIDTTLINIDISSDTLILENIVVSDPDTFPLVSADVTINGFEPLEPNVFTGKVCVDEMNAITKMATVCELSYNFVKLLSFNASGSDAELETDENDNNILTTTGGTDSYLNVSADLSSFEGTLNNLMLAFWIKPDTDGSGYIAFLSNNDASERYFAVYYKSPDRFTITFKQVGISGLAGQVHVVFQLPESIEDNLYHFIMIYYSDRTIEMSVDGNPVISSAVSYANIYDKLYGKLTQH